MKDFKLFGGTSIPDLGNYCNDYLNKHPDVQVWVGSDSKEGSKSTTYATVVCFYHANKGAHVIFKKYSNNGFVDLHKRLWNEVEDSKLVAEYLEEKLMSHRNEITKNLVEIDLDVNKSELYKSNKVYDAAVGYLKGLGYIVRTKPEMVAAVCAADLLCK